MMPAAATGDVSLRHVRKLRLAVSSAQAERRALRVLEESLRLISLPDEATGRIFYFRRLQLPPPRPDEHPVSYAGELEQKCRTMAQAAVHFCEPAAHHADVVFATSPVEPWQELARHVTRAQPLDCWFWRVALPQSVPFTRLRSPLDVLLQVADRHSAQGVLEFLAGMEPDVLRAIFAQLEVSHVVQGKLPMFSMPVDFSHSARSSQVGKKLLDRLPSLWRQLAKEYAAKWKDEEDAPDLRLQWLMSAAWLIAEPERAMDRRMPEQVACMVEALAEEAQPHAVQRISAQQQSTATAAQRHAPGAFADRGSAAESWNIITDDTAQDFQKAFSDPPPVAEQLRGNNTGNVKQEGAEPLFVHSAGSPDVTAIRPQEQKSLEDSVGSGDRRVINEADAKDEVIRKHLSETNLTTSYAGFFYCLGLLDRMGIGETLSANPQLLEMNFVHYLLRALAIAAGVPQEDPVALKDLWLHGPQAIAADAELPCCSSLLPSGWTWKKRQAQPPVLTLEKLVRIWVLALRRRVWRAARMSWAEMAKRPGEINALRTYLEITMPQSSLEVRARKAGFDLDPGWLPWLNKVVLFHYSCQMLEVIPVGGMRRAPTAAMLSRVRQTRVPDGTRDTDEKNSL